MARIPIVNPRNPEKFVLYKILELKKSQKASILNPSISGVSATVGNSQSIADGTYVESLAASGQTGMKGAITLTGGSFITLTQVTSPSNDILIDWDGAGLNDLDDVLLSGVASGDILYFNGTNWVNLAKGTNGQVLKLAGGLPTWAAAATGDVTASANITDHAIVRGDGGAKGVQDSGVLIDDSDNMSCSSGSIAFSRSSSTTIQGTNSGSTGTGVFGYNSSATGATKGVYGYTDSSDNASYGGSFIRLEATTHLDILSSSTPSNPGSGKLRFYRLGDDRPYARTNGGDVHDLSRTVRGWHIAEGVIGTTNSFNCSKADQDTSNTSASGSIIFTTRGSTNFSTGAVESYQEVIWVFRRMSNTLVWSKDVLFFAPFQKDGDTAEATILMREGSSHTGANAIDSISFHITDGTTVSSASPTQFNSLGTSWGKFTTGEIDVSGYGDDLYWVLKINGENTSVGTDYSQTVHYDLHSVLVEQWAV